MANELQQQWNQKTLNEKIDWFESDDSRTESSQDLAMYQALLAQRRSGRGRTFTQGLTFGFGDELEAFARRGLGLVSGGEKTYQEIRDEIRNKIEDYRQANPAEALGYEALGAIAPTALALMSGIGTGAGVSGIGRIAGRSALAGGASALGYSESDLMEGELGGLAQDVVVGAGIGTAIGGGLSLAGRGIGRIVDDARRRLGDRPARVVQNEIERLVENTGKSPEEIVQDLMMGNIMAENRTLESYIATLQAQGGRTGAFVRQSTQERASQTRNLALQAMNQELAGQQDNVLRVINKNLRDLAQDETDLYARAYGRTPSLNQNLTSEITDILQSYPEVLEPLRTTYRRRNLIPLFRTSENGAINLERVPTVQDAEIIRRRLRTLATQEIRSGDNDAGMLASERQQSLRRLLDQEYPSLRIARENSSMNFDIKEAYDLGPKAFTKDVDFIELEVERFSEFPDAIAALRMGFARAINRKKNNANFMSKISNEGSNENEIFRLIFPDRSVDEVIAMARTATNAATLYRRVGFGSQTEPVRQATLQANNIRLADAVRSLDAAQIIRALTAKINSAKPNMTDPQRSQIARMLFTQDVDELRNMLIDDTAFARGLNALEAGASIGGGQMGGRIAAN